MKIKASTAPVIIIGFIVAVAFRFLAIAAIDTPHNTSNNISCGSCHGAALLNSPFWGGSYTPANIDDTVYNKLCLNCHRASSGPYTDTNAPLVKTHSSLSTSNKYGDWTRECRTCHDPHYQKQKNYKNTDAGNLYLATGTITSCVYNGDGTSTLTYSTITYKSVWDATKLTDKTGDYRRAILFPNVGKLGYNYPITAVDTPTAGTITVTGNATAYLYPPATFAAMYGQYSKDFIDVSGTNMAVKFFDKAGTKSFADGDSTYNGVCEVCHTKTKYFRYDGGVLDQIHTDKVRTNCTICHSHVEGFKPSCKACHGYPPGLNDGSLVFIDKDGNPVTSDSSGVGAHAEHYTAGFACINCHTGGMLQGAPQGDNLINIGFNLNSANLGGTYDGKTGRTVFSYAAGGSTTVTANGSLECSNLYCHGSTLAPDGGTDTTPVWNDSSTGACGTCHGATAENPPTRGSHSIHAGSAQLVCSNCHNGYESVHVDGNVHIEPGSGVSFVPEDGSCSNISCHSDTNAEWGNSACLYCHSISINNRAAITPQFNNANSHHIQLPQEVLLTGAHCYQCHWEANSDGTINHTYHGGKSAPNSPVDLVIYLITGELTQRRPTTYTLDVTAKQYTANDAVNRRVQLAKINDHCLGCHRTENDAVTPFGDGKTSNAYAWDGTSVAAKYSQTGTTTWGKYSGANITPKNTQTKAYSAHGNAINNQGGWDLNEVWLNTRNGTENIVCFDCHNSHGSTVSGTTTSYASITTNGGILKDTMAGKGGYSLTYKPQSGGSTSNKNSYNAGAGLCFDCHMNAAADTTPWGYNNTFGATEAIKGYYDRPYFDFSLGVPGAKQRFSYRMGASGKGGGHFGASSSLSGTPAGTIGGLCTPCHDPHGVSTTFGANQQYAMPLLKGTWLTSPYKEDVAPASNTAGTVRDSTYPVGVGGPYSAGVQYHIDQNTFGANIRASVTGITQTDTQFAGLCLNCHSKNSLTDGTNGGTWKSVDRIHESVKGWGANVKHNYSCSKCHTPHSSGLPRLMITNCLNSLHKGRTNYNPSPVTSGSGSGDDIGCYGMATISAISRCTTDLLYLFSSGGGAFPGSWYSPDWGNFTVTCHESKSADQSWNVKTQWAQCTPTISTGPTAGSFTATGSNVQATITWQTASCPSNSYVDYGLTSSYGLSTGNDGMASNHSILLQNLMNHSTYHYRVRSTSISDEVISGDNTFYISIPPTVPTLIDEPNAICTGSCSVTLQWNAAADPDGGPIEYQVEVDTSNSFNTGNKQTSSWISATSWSPTLATNTTWYWRVKARDANHTTVDDPTSTWSTTDSFIISDGIVPPQVTLVNPANGAALYTDCDQLSMSVGFSWNAVPPLAEYYVQINNAVDFSGSNDYTSGWIANTSWGSPAIDIGTWYWRVQARDAVSQATGAWSDTWSFSVNYGGDCSGTCPIVYTWDGGKYAFESDVYTRGKLGLKYGTGFVKPNPNDYYILLNNPVEKNGYLELKIVEENFETNYLDNLKLYALDYPQNRNVYSEILFTNPQYVDPATLLHTVAPTLSNAVSMTHVNTGTDVSAKVSISDGDYLVLSNDRNTDFDWNTIELDLGDLSGAPQIKLVIDAVSAFPNKPEGSKRAASLEKDGQRTLLEVLDADGNWVIVPKTTGVLPIPKGFRRPYIVDISDIFQTNIYKVRLSFLYKTYIDSIRFDTTLDEPVTVTEVPLDSAELTYYGFSKRTSPGEIYEHIYGDKSTMASSYMPGGYTKFGGVTPLLSETDDKFIIFGSGDELSLRFLLIANGPEGTLRRFLVYFAGYYKNKNNPNIEQSVEPLPFAAMSNFPYDASVESYPTDAEHEQYRLEYNTREK